VNPAAFPWAACLYAASIRLGWTPSDFWAATPRELWLALGGGTYSPLTRATFGALLCRFPDTPQGTNSIEEQV